jgi:hypothetical protein
VTTTELSIKGFRVSWGRDSITQTVVLRGTAVAPAGWDKATSRRAVSAIRIFRAGEEVYYEQNPRVSVDAQGTLTVLLRMEWRSKVTAQTPGGIKDQTAAIDKEVREGMDLIAALVSNQIHGAPVEAEIDWAKPEKELIQ